MSLDPPTYLASLQNNIRQRPIPWEGAVRAGTLTEDQLAKIKAVERAKKEARTQTVEGDLDGYRILFAGEEGKPSVLELARKRTEVVQYILVLLSDLLDSTLNSARAYVRPCSRLEILQLLTGCSQASPPYRRRFSRTATHTSTSSRYSHTPPAPKTLYPSSPPPS